jgi:hypothetical protein
MAMVERRRLRRWGEASGDGDGGSGTSARDYKVGYGRPPLHSRFVTGQSGNPKGRRKGSRNLKTDVRRTLAVPVKMRVGDRMQTRSTQEAALLILRGRALKGNERAIEKLLELARHHNNDELEAAASQPLAEDDYAILAAYVAQAGAPPIDPIDIDKLEDDPWPDELTHKKKGAIK